MYSVTGAALECVQIVLNIISRHLPSLTPSLRTAHVCPDLHDQPSHSQKTSRSKARELARAGFPGTIYLKLATDPTVACLTLGPGGRRRWSEWHSALPHGALARAPGLRRTARARKCTRSGAIASPAAQRRAAGRFRRSSSFHSVMSRRSARRAAVDPHHLAEDDEEDDEDEPAGAMARGIPSRARGRRARARAAVRA